MYRAWKKCFLQKDGWRFGSFDHQEAVGLRLVLGGAAQTPIESYNVRQNRCRNRAMNTATDRLEMRLPPEEKGLLARAAQLEGVKLSQFVLGPALKRARRIIAAAEQVTVSAKGYGSVLDALANPPKPTRALIAAMRDYEAVGIQWR
ncbi:DUF1778 domain-containing protein [Metallibacterium sp.]|uniref:type II toxin-antitoxin system TacA family antitoxin n=2 Tax=Metallibacterium sp. TaxID=2940281 RepID=UPI002627A153|nr:DUF1778 domain-containing protein [Metallibacterium sp.]